MQSEMQYTICTSVRVFLLRLLEFGNYRQGCLKSSPIVALNWNRGQLDMEPMHGGAMLSHQKRNKKWRFILNGNIHDKWLIWKIPQTAGNLLDSPQDNTFWRGCKPNIWASIFRVGTKNLKRVLDYEQDFSWPVSSFIIIWSSTSTRSCSQRSFYAQLRKGLWWQSLF